MQSTINDKKEKDNIRHEIEIYKIYEIRSTPRSCRLFYTSGTHSISDKSVESAPE